MRSIVAVVLVAGCNLYFGSSPPDPDAGTCAGEGSGSSGENLRDPSTGQCTLFPACAPCQVCNTVDIPAWPQCLGPCDGLAEQACLANAACHAAYVDAAGGPFLGCWNVGPGSQPAASCNGLDAATCAAQHACASLLADGSFTRCVATPAPDGDPGICYGSVQCNDAPPDCPVGTVAGITNGCWSGYCIPTTKCPD